MNAIQDLFKDKNYCFAEIGRIRASISNKSATAKEFDAATDTLAFMALYCPEEVSYIVRAQISETATRQSYAMLRNPDFFKR